MGRCGNLNKKNKLNNANKNLLYQSAKRIAEDFQTKYIDKSQPIRDTFEILEQLGFFIVQFPADDKLSGFHIKKSDYNCIFINSAHTLGRQYFSAWHECYHAFTNDVGGISLSGEAEYDETEFKADSFASCILLPEDLVMQYLRENKISNVKYITYDQLIVMQNYFRVSYSSLITRLIKLFPENKIDLSKRYSLGRQSSVLRLEKKVNEVGGDLSLIRPTNDFYISPKFYEKLYSNLDQDRITVDKTHSILEFLESVKNYYGK